MQNDVRNIHLSHHNNNKEISILKKRHRSEDVKWTLEEEFLFFEIHKIFGNKWSKFAFFSQIKKLKNLKIIFMLV